MREKANAGGTSAGEVLSASVSRTERRRRNFGMSRFSRVSFWRNDPSLTMRDACQENGAEIRQEEPAEGPRPAISAGPSIIVRRLLTGRGEFSGKTSSRFAATAMRIQGPRRPDQVNGRSAPKTGGQGETFQISGKSEAHAAAATGATLQVAALESLLALQEASEPLTGRKRAVRRANDMLDLLDDMKVGMLAGSIPRQTLRRLTSLVADRRDDFNEPGLQGVIDEIDLRAQVELAKLEMAAA